MKNFITILLTIIMLAFSGVSYAETSPIEQLLTEFSSTFSYVKQNDHDNQQPDILMDLSILGSCLVIESNGNATAHYCNQQPKGDGVFKANKKSQSAILTYETTKNTSRYQIDLNQKTITIRQTSKYGFTGFIFLIVPYHGSNSYYYVTQFSCENGQAFYKTWEENKNHSPITIQLTYAKPLGSCAEMQGGI